jgi:hypothetical protein
LYASCPRAFYFAEIQRPEGPIQYQFSGLAEIVGISVHEAIFNEIQRIRPGMGFNAKRAAKDAARLVDSKSAVLRHDSLRYGRDSGARAIRSCEIAAWKLLTSFGRFVWPRYQGHTLIAQEKTARFEIEGVSISVKPDLVTEAPDGTIVVTDWKTYADAKPEEELLQLSVYILWAGGKFRVPIESVEGWVATLPNGEIRQERGSAAMVKQAVRRIMQDVSHWRIFTPELFPPNPGPEKCSPCPFLAFCPEGMEVAAWLAGESGGDEA